MSILEITINRIQDGNGSTGELYESLNNFIALQKKVNLPYTKTGIIDEDELLSFIWLGIEAAVKTYNPNRNCSFLTWASSCIKYGILSYLNKNRVNCISLDAFIDDEQQIALMDTLCDPNSYGDFDRIEDNTLGKLALTALKNLPKEERQIVTLCCIKNVPLSRAAKICSISLGRARTLKIRGLTNLKKAVI